MANKVVNWIKIVVLTPITSKIIYMEIEYVWSNPLMLACQALDKAMVK